MTMRYAVAETESGTCFNPAHHHCLLIAFLGGSQQTGVISEQQLLHLTAVTQMVLDQVKHHLSAGYR